MEPVNSVSATNTSGDSNKFLRSAIGLGLIGFSFYLVSMILHYVKDILAWRIENIPIFEKFVVSALQKGGMIQAAINGQAVKFVLPDSVFYGMGFFIGWLFLSILVKMALGFLSAGIRLLLQAR